MSWRCLTRLTSTIKLFQVQQEMQLAMCFGERCLWQKAYCGIQTLLLGTNYYSSRQAPTVVCLNKRNPGLKTVLLRCWFYLLGNLRNRQTNKQKVNYPITQKWFYFSFLVSYFCFCFSFESLEQKSNLKMVPLILIYTIYKYSRRPNWVLPTLNLTDTLISSE